MPSLGRTASPAITNKCRPCGGKNRFGMRCHGTQFLCRHRVQDVLREEWVCETNPEHTNPCYTRQDEC